MGASWKLQLLEPNKGSFYNQENWIEEYKCYKGLCCNNYRDDFDEESNESDNNVDSEKGSDSDCKNDRVSKNSITSEKNYYIHKYAASSNNLSNKM